MDSWFKPAAGLVLYFQSTPLALPDATTLPAKKAEYLHAAAGATVSKDLSFSGLFAHYVLLHGACKMHL